MNKTLAATGAVLLAVSLSAPAFAQEACKNPIQLANGADSGSRTATGTVEKRTYQDPKLTKPTVAYLLKLDAPRCIMMGATVRGPSAEYIFINWNFAPGIPDLDPHVGKRVTLKGRFYGSVKQRSGIGDDPRIGDVGWVGKPEITPAN